MEVQLDDYGYHSARLVVDEHLERRRREASAERLARRIGSTTQTRTGTLARTLSSVIRRDTRPVHVQPES
jgi:hypothetical protein